MEASIRGLVICNDLIDVLEQASLPPTRLNSSGRGTGITGLCMQDLYCSLKTRHME